MNRKKYWIVIIALITSVALIGCKRKADLPPGLELRVKASQTKMSMIKHFTSAYVALDSMPPAAEKFGITEEALLTYLQQWFRQQGVNTISEKQYKRAFFSGKPARRISVNPSIYEENGKIIVEL